MKHLIIALILLTSLKLTAQVPDSLKVTSLPLADFQTAIQNDNKALLADVREFFEYRKSRIKNAVNIPSSGDLKPAIDTISRTRSLYFYCTSGFRSKRVGVKFYDKGFTKVFSLNGGIKAWRKEGMAVDKKKLKKDKRK
jgi:rhodanese-related sulfurtransferase